MPERTPPPTPLESELAQQEEEIRAALQEDPRYSETISWLRQLEAFVSPPRPVRYVISTNGTSGLE